MSAPALELLPHPRARMTARRKAEIVQAIHVGSVTRAAVMERYGLSSSEILSWEVQFRVHGQAGLAVTRMQEFRRHG